MDHRIGQQLRYFSITLIRMDVFSKSYVRLYNWIEEGSSPCFPREAMF